MAKIGFIGTGVMGSSMAGHLLQAGHELLVYNRTASKTDSLVSRGAVRAETVAELATQADIIFSIVGDPADVEQIYLGEEGVLVHAGAGTVAVDMTTSSPDLARRLHEEGQAREIRLLDAPVSGGDKGAREGTLSIMVGGDREVYDQVLPLFQLMGANVVYQGPAGSGQKTKMANQIAVAGGMLGVCEAMAYAVRSGLDASTVLQSIESGAAGSWALSNLAPRMLEGDFDPGFFVKHFIKDMRIALESSEEQKLDLPGLRLALEQYLKLAEQGGAEDGTQALYRLLVEKD